MNTPPDTSLTFRELLTRVAEECDWAYYDPNNPDSPADIPRDRQLLDKMKRGVNDGLRRLYRAYSWSFLRPAVSIPLTTDGAGPFNIDSDATMYALPWNVQGRPLNGWQWGLTDQTISGKAADCSIEAVNLKHLSVNSIGYPQMIGLAPFPQSGDSGDRQRYYFRVWPTPQDAYTVQATFLQTPIAMVQLTDRHVAGAMHDETVLAFALLAVKEHDAKDPAMRQTYKDRADRALAESIRVDQENVPRSIGRMSDPSIEYGGTRRYVRPGLDYVNGAAAP